MQVMQCPSIVSLKIPQPSVYYAQSILDPQPKIITTETYKAEDDSKYDSVAGMISQQKS
jgi:hypothetical protein